MLLLAATASAAGLADCPRQFVAADLVTVADTAEKAFRETDREGFLASRGELQARAGCVGEKLTPEVAARIHRVEALAAGFEKQRDRIPEALAGLFAAEPGHQLPFELLPEGHPVRKRVGDAIKAAQDDEAVDLPKVPRVTFLVDGEAARTVPARRAAVVQELAEGAVIVTHYRWPEETDFGWVVRPEPPAAPAGTTAQNRWVWRGPLLGVSAASLVGSGLLLGFAVDNKVRFDEAPVLPADASDEERDAYRDLLEEGQANNEVLTVGAAVAAGVAAIGAVTVVVTW